MLASWADAMYSLMGKIAGVRLVTVVGYVSNMGTSEGYSIWFGLLLYAAATLFQSYRGGERYSKI
jgi:hypothetical protein